MPQIVSQSPLPVVELTSQEKITDEFLSQIGSFAFVNQGGTVFALRQTALHTYLSPVKSTDQSNLLTQYYKPSYESKFTYLLRNNWANHKISKADFQYVMKYFQELYNRDHVEAAVLLMFNETTKAWKVLPVLQLDCSGTAVNYLIPRNDISNVEFKDKALYELAWNNQEAKAKLLKTYDQYQSLIDEGYALYGTIHSHCNFSAFHSGTDDNDEKDFSGLHITIGNVNSGWSFSARYMLDGSEFKIENITDIVDAESLEDLLEGLDSVAINQEDMDLMMANLRRPVFNNYSSGPYYNWKEDTKDSGTYRRYHNDLWSNRDNDDNKWYSWNEDNDPADPENYDEVLDHIILYNDFQSLYDTKKQKIVLVKFSFYHQNREKFKGRFVPIADPTPDREMIEKHRTNKQPFGKKEKKKKKDRDGWGVFKFYNGRKG